MLNNLVCNSLIRATAATMVVGVVASMARGQLQPGNPSFSAGGNLDLLTHNFGSVRQGAPALAINFAVYNLAAPSGTTADISLVETDSLGDAGTIALVHSSIAGLGVGEHVGVQLALSTSTPGQYSVSYTMAFASDGLPELNDQLVALAGFAKVLHAGDYEMDGDVDEDDFLKWRSHFGQSSPAALEADGNFDSVVDSADYTVWRDSLILYTSGSGADSSSAPPISEPSSMMLAVVAVIVGLVPRKVAALVQG